MSRGLLGEAGLAETSRHLPDLTDLRDIILNLSPGFLPIKFPRESSIPIAAACLHDALRSVEEATYAFHEILAHRKWYLEKREAPNELTAIFFSKFYADDVALRLYSAGEHMANALLFMLEVSKHDLDRYKKKNRISLQVVVGHYLINEYPNDPVTKAILKLVKSKGWLKTIKYRNDWVHNQPPTIEGLGIVYERRNRWIISEHDALLTFGGGDKPTYKIEDIVGVVRLALFLFIEVLTEVTRHYTELITEKGSSFA
jgi:hypothetical protein